MHNSLIDKLDTSGPLGIYPFVRQNKLGSCLHRLASRTDELDLSLIAKDFVLKNERRVRFFGKF